jgi:metal-responsive CopG/Arc/MetJ family transcriptional regulator
MVTSDDDMMTDIVLEGDTEEIDRMIRELGLREKGKVYVKGLLEA